MISLLLIVFCAFFFVGIIIRTKSWASGRKGAGIFQPIKDIYVLLRKGSVFSTNTSVIFQIAPVISLASVLTALLVIPFGDHAAMISFTGDFIFFAYLLAFGKFFQIIGALDTGSGFEGMGANREALYSMIIEPAFFVLIGTLSMLSGYISFSDIFSNIHFDNNYSYIIGCIAIYLLVQIAMAENSRLPVDDPKTHLELTMVHEVMVLDNSGFDMALIHITTALKFSLYGALITNCILPIQAALPLQVAVFLFVQVIFALTVGLLESFRARNRMKNNPRYVLSISAIALIAFAVILLISNKLI